MRGTFFSAPLLCLLLPAPIAGGQTPTRGDESRKRLEILSRFLRI